jgi:putative sterol carrier protein
MPAKVSVEQFFDKIVPQHLKTLKVPAKKQHTYVFRLFGANAAVWTLDTKRKKVSKGGLEKPDLYLEMDEADFSNMLGETLNVEEAVLNGRIRFQGDIKLLADLGSLLTVKD